MPKLINPDDLAKIQYHGEYGVTQSCLNAIIRLIHFGHEIEQVKLLTLGNSHCFLLSISTEKHLIAIKAGFSSGYCGEGPRGLSTALQLLERYVSWIEEYNISSEIFDRINNSCLLYSDLEIINAATEVIPSKLRGYIYAGLTEYIYSSDASLNKIENQKRLQDEFPRVIPFRFIDYRIIDLAMKFKEDPDSSIVSAYRRLESVVRQRTGLQNEIVGAKLFSKVFRGEKPLLYWEDVEPGEQQGRAYLFEGAYMAFRNRRAHRELRLSLDEEIREFMLLNELFLLEAQAINRSQTTE